MKGVKETKMTLAAARKIQRMLEGATVPSSSFPFRLAEDLRDEGVLEAVVRGSTCAYRAGDVEALRQCVERRYTGGVALSRWMEGMTASGSPMSRARLVAATGDSKARRVRTFCGFLVNCCEKMEVELDGKRLTLLPVPGMAYFVQHPDTFRIPEDVVVVGVENGENFQQLQRQRHLFADFPRVLFVSRYPQSGDLRRWLSAVPNRYLHFGDFDLAGIQIFQTEFFRFLGERSAFFVPADIEERLRRGNAHLYEVQYEKLGRMKVDDVRLQWLVELIHRYRRGYEQEGYLEPSGLSSSE